MFVCSFFGSPEMYVSQYNLQLYEGYTNKSHRWWDHQGFTFLLTICSPPASSSVVNQSEVTVTSASYH